MNLYKGASTPSRRHHAALSHIPTKLRVCVSEDRTVLLVIAEQAAVVTALLMDAVDGLDVGRLQVNELNERSDKCRSTRCL
jgi:hypothetical protein